MIDIMKSSIYSLKTLQARGVLILTIVITLLSLLAGYAITLISDYLLWTNEEAVSLLLLNIIIIFPFALALLRNGHVNVFEPVYTFSFIFFIAFVLSPLIMLSRGQVGVRANDYRQQLTPALLLATTGLIGCYAGYVWGRSRFQDFHQTSNRIKINNKAVFRLASLALFLTATIFYLWLDLAKIPLSYLNALEENARYGNASQFSGDASLYLFTFHLSWPILILQAWKHTSNRFWRVIIIILWFVNLAIYVMVANRSNIYFLLGATFILFYLQRRKQPRIYAVLALFAVFVLTSGYLVTARGGSEATIETKLLLDDLATEITDRGAATGLMGVVSVFPDKVSFLGIKALSDVVYAPVPRAIWLNKPSLRPVQDILNALLPARAHAPGAMGIFYAGFGPIGPFIILFCYGVLSAWLFEFWRQRPGNEMAQLLLAAWIPFLWILIHRGVLSKQLVEVAYRFGPIILVYTIAKWGPWKQKKPTRSIK